MRRAADVCERRRRSTVLTVGDTCSNRRTSKQKIYTYRRQSKHRAKKSACSFSGRANIRATERSVAFAPARLSRAMKNLIALVATRDDNTNTILLIAHFTLYSATRCYHRDYIFHLSLYARSFRVDDKIPTESKSRRVATRLINYTKRVGSDVFVRFLVKKKKKLEALDDT